MRQALSSAPGEAAYHCDLALPLRAREHYEDALQSLDRALAIEPGMRAALNIKASLLSFLGRGRAAADILETLAGLPSADASVHLRLGLARRNLGEMNAARTSLAKAIAITPDLSAAYWLLSTLSTASEAGNHIAQMERLLGASSDSQAEVELGFALAKEYEDLQSYEQAFEHLARANRLRRAQLSYDAEEERAFFAAIEDTFSGEFLAGLPGSGCSEPGPVFVVGMPRTGSTLLERILAGHTELGSAGELQVLEGLVLAEQRRKGVKFPQLARALNGDDLERLGQAYLAGSRPFRDASPLFIDKMPMNFLYVGLIRAILPAARVISIRRDPIDTCFSCYKQLFGAHYRFSYDLRELADYYRLYDRLMRHWESVLPGQILTLHYEDLVSDTENEARRALAFLGLEWQAACLDFQRAPDAVRTPSAVQVREAPHRRSIGRWRHYRQQLAPLIEALPSS